MDEPQTEIDERVEQQPDEPRLLTTREFGLTPQKYFQILTTQIFQRNAWAYVGLVAVIIVAVAIRPPLVPLLILVALAVGTPVYQLWKVRRHAYAAENSPLFKRHVLEITPILIVARGEDGTVGEVRVNEINRVARGPDYYLLYVTRTGFLYIPHEAFQSAADRRAFEAMIGVEL